MLGDDGALELCFCCPAKLYCFESVCCDSNHIVSINTLQSELDNSMTEAGRTVFSVCKRVKSGIKGSLFLCGELQIAHELATWKRK